MVVFAKYGGTESDTELRILRASDILAEVYPSNQLRHRIHAKEA